MLARVDVIFTVGVSVAVCIVVVGGVVEFKVLVIVAANVVGGWWVFEFRVLICWLVLCWTGVCT